MSIYRKKPVEIEARQYDGTNRGNLVAWIEKSSNFKVPNPLGKHFIIPTLEGQHVATIGDYIIKGVQGEFYPCKPDIFAETYAPVSSVGAP